MMVIISCGAKKLNRPAPAKDLYIGLYFKYLLTYALTRAPAENIYNHWERLLRGAER